MELVRPQLELQGLFVQIVVGVHEPFAVRSAMDSMGTASVVAVVVGENADRWSVRHQLDAFSAVADASHRLFVLDLRKQSSVVRQVRAVTRAVDGLRRSLDIDCHSSARLSASASMGASVAGECVAHRSSTSPGLRVVVPPVLLMSPLHGPAEVVPAHVRFPAAPPCRQNTQGTQPDLVPPED
jgi:hypothetical protein